MGDTLYFDDWGVGSDVQVSGDAEWWKEPLAYVIKAAADAKWKAPAIGSNQQWLMTADGRLVPAGVTGGKVLNAQQQEAPQWAVFAMLGLGAVMLIKLVK